MVLCLTIEQCGGMLKQCIYCDSATHVSRQLLICFTLSLSIVLRLAMFIPAECCKMLQTSANIPKLPLLRLCCETALVNDPGVDDRRGTAGQRRAQSTWSSVETVRFRLCWTVSANEAAKPKIGETFHVRLLSIALCLDLFGGAG